MDALAFATLGFASDGTGAGGTTAVILADIEIDGILDVAAVDTMIDAVTLDPGDAVAVEVSPIPEVAQPDAATPEPDVEIDPWA